MKFKEYVKNLQNLLKENLEIAEYDVVYSEDDEGNGFGMVCFEPTIGRFDKDDREFYAETDEPNAVCIN